jgi:hypothetical protein
MLPAVSAAQRVSGTVRDSASHGVIAGAVVVVLDSVNHALARGLTDGTGHYALELTPSAAHLRVVRIGFRPHVVAMQGVMTRSPLDVNMERLSTLLTAVEVNDERVCSRDQGRVAALALWEQARAGLLAAIVAREANPAQASIITYERHIDTERQRTVWQTSRKLSGQTSRPFVAARKPSEFAERGYAENENGRIRFFAPDADVLLDESFAHTHCFTVAKTDDDHAGAIGLAFEPARNRDGIIDVRGVLWIESAVPALRSIEYRYTGNDSILTHREARGLIHFRAMTNGVTFIDEWMSRLPVLSERQGMQSAPAAYPNASRRASVTAVLHVDQYGETGGIVISAKWPDGLGWKSPLEPLTGTVTEERSTRPMAGVLIATPASGDTVLTDSLGRFAIYPLFPGLYSLSIADTIMGGFVEPRGEMRDVKIAHEGANEVHAQLPSRLQAIRRLCEDTAVSNRRAILLGRLVNTNENMKLPKGLRVQAKWVDNRGLVMTSTMFHAETRNDGVEVDDRGRFSACDVERPQIIRLVLMRGRFALADTSIAIQRETEIERVVWPVSAKAIAEFQPPKPAQLAGRILTPGGGAPLAGAEVWLPALDRRATTDSSGRFTLGDLPARFALIQVRKVGFVVQRDTATFVEGATTSREYTLAPQSTATLDTVRTVAKAGGLSPALRGFEERKLRGEAGYFIDETELRKHDVEPLSSVIFSRASGVKLIPGSSGATYLASSRKACGGGALASGCKPCFVTTYVDGMLLYDESGEMSTDPPDATRINVSDLAGVEFYATSAVAPVQYNRTGSGCGVLLIWTRER